MYTQEEKDKMAMKNSTIDKFAAKNACPPGQVSDGKGGCVYPLFKKGDNGIERVGTTTSQIASDSSYQVSSGYKASPFPGYPETTYFKKPKDKAESDKNKADAKAGNFYKRKP